MSWVDRLRELNEIDLNDLDLENVGSWPAAARAIVSVKLTRLSGLSSASC